MSARILYTLLFSCLLSLSMQAQQDPMFTKYMFMPMTYNPAYAGTAKVLDMGVLHRQQWWGIEGAPMTQAINLHSPIEGKNIGLGLNMSLDQIANSRQFNVYGSFAYHIPINKSVKLSIGMQGGVSNWAADWTDLELEDLNDPAFQNLQPNLWLPNFGGGLYLFSEKWFLGLSAPMLINNALRQETNNPNIPVAQQYRHYYVSGGVAIPLNSTMVFRPSLLVKHVGLFEKNELNNVAAPTEMDVDLSLLFNNRLWVGASFRTALQVIDQTSTYDSVDFWISMRFENGLRIGAAYDYTLTELQGPAQGSYEIMLGYDLMRYKGKTKHVRYF